MIQTLLILITLVIAIIGYFRREKGRRALTVMAISLLVISALFQTIIVTRRNQEEAELNQKLSRLISGSDSLFTKNQDLLRQNEGLLRKVENYQTILEEQKQAVENIRDYAYVSKLGPSGKSLAAGFGIKHSTGISRIIEATLTEKKDGRVYFKCDDESLKRYERTIQEYPRFPFSYVGMADCLRRRGDDKWKEYASKAINIFEVTTKIDGHDKSHEDTMEQILRDLND